MVSTINDVTILNNGAEMPWLGFGVWRMRPGEETENAVRVALETGYRSLDTAAAYRNEANVGRAVRASGIPREELFITTKVWNADQGYQETLRAFDDSRKQLGTDYIDLYLIHWPVAGRYRDTWRALEKLYAEALVRAIGVSNFHVHHLEDLLAGADIIPAVNQVEFHPFLTQNELRKYCSEREIQFEAWSPLAEGRALTHPTIVEVAKKYERTPAQALIRWDLQHRVVTIPKSSHAHRIAQNAAVFDFELADADMRLIDSLNRDERVGPDPDNFDF
jgi:diketogulonate reductase-like aldo/keto reductase